MIFLAWIWRFVDAGLIQNAEVSGSNLLVRTTSNIQFSITFPTKIEENHSVIFVFPDGLELPSNLRCSVEGGVEKKDQIDCQAENNEVTITSCFPSNGELIIFTVYAINTPKYALTTQSFLVYSLNQNGVVVDNLDSGLYLEFFPVSMKDAMISVDSKGNWTLTVSTNFEIEELVLQFPNKEEFLNGYQNSYCTEEPQCQNISSNFYSDFIFHSPCLCSQNSLLLKGSSSGGNSTITFSLPPPPSSGQINGFYLYSKLPQGKIENFSLEAQSEYQAFLNISYQSNSNELGSEANLLLDMICENPIPTTANFSLEFENFDVNNVLVYGAYGIHSEVSMRTEPNFIEIYDSVKYSLQGGTLVRLLLIGVQNPNSKNLAKVRVEIRHSENGVLCSGDVKIEIEPHYLDVTLEVSTTQINQEASYFFHFDSELVTNTSLITIEFPAGISVSKATNGSAFDFSIHGNLVLFSSFEVLDEKVTLQLDSVKNPNNTAKTQEFSIILYESMQNLVKIGKNIQVSFTPSAGMIKASILTQSDKVASVTDYVFQVILENQGSDEGSLLVLFPEEVKITASSACTQMVNLPSSAFCMFSMNQVRIKNLFNPGFSLNFQFTLTNIRNPLNTCGSKSFQITTYENDLVLDKTFSELSVLTGTPEDLEVEAHISSVVVGEISHLDVRITSSLFEKTLLVVFPDGFELGEASCKENSESVLTLTCEKETNYSLVVNFELSRSGNTTFEFSIENIKNPSKTTKNEQVLFVLKSESCEISSGYSSVWINKASKLSVNWTMTDQMVGSLSNYSFSISYSNLVPPSGYLELSLPESINPTEETFCIPSCKINSNSIHLPVSIKVDIYFLKNSENSSTSNIFSLSTRLDSSLIDSFNSSPFFHKCLKTCLTCFHSPSLCKSCPSNSFLFNSNCLSECPSGFGLLDSTCIACEVQCKSCSSNSSFCLKCQEGLAYKGTCVKSCPVNQSIEVNKTICLDCLDSCLTCAESTENCTSCKTGFFLYLGQCLENCPVGLVGLNGECKACSCPAEKLNNSQCDPECDNEACGYDNFDCSQTLSLKSMPSVTAAAGSAVMTAGNKVIGKGEMLGPTVALWTLTQTCSWVSFTYELSKHSDESKGRRLTELNTSEVFELFLAVILINFLMNLGFTFAYFFKFSREDMLHHDWMKQHKFFTVFIGIISAIFSFQLIRLTYTGPSCLKCCRSPFFRVSTITVILMVYTVCYCLLVLTPAITLLVYVLFTYDSSHKIYANTIDCLVLTVLIALTTLFDLVKLSIQIGIEKERPATATVVPEKERMPDETFEMGKDDQIHTERRLRDTGMTEMNEINEFFEPEDEDHEKIKWFSIGSVVFNEEFEVVETNSEYQVFEAVHCKSQTLYLVKEVEYDEQERKAWKILDFQQIHGTWTIGKNVDEDHIKEVKVWNGQVDKVRALHRSGLEIILVKSFVGGYLNDFATGTPLYRVLCKDDEKLLIVDDNDPSYASLRLDGQLMRVFRSFDNSLLIDVFPKTNLCDVSFSKEIPESSDDILGTAEGPSLSGRLLKQKLSPLPIKSLNLKS